MPASHDIFELSFDSLTLQGVAQGGVETCIRVPELGIVFDIGRCPPGTISGKFSRLFLSHAHLDHFSGLPYFVAQRAMMNLPAPIVHLPAEIADPVSRLLKVHEELEEMALPIELSPHLPGDRFALGKGLWGTALRSHHRVPSLAYVIEREQTKLLAEFKDYPGPQIAELRKQGTQVSETSYQPILAVTGDTKIELFEQEPLLRRARVLVHEVTAWDDRRDVEQTRRWGHTHLDEIAGVLDQFEGESLVLVHRSLRHSRRDCLEILKNRFSASQLERLHVFGY